MPERKPLAPEMLESTARQKTAWGSDSITYQVLEGPECEQTKVIRVFGAGTPVSGDVEITEELVEGINESKARLIGEYVDFINNLHDIPIPGQNYGFNCLARLTSLFC